MGERTRAIRGRESQGVADALSRCRQLGRVPVRGLRCREMAGQSITRRTFFRTMSGGIYGAALAHLLGRETAAHAADSPADLKPRPAHFPAKAKSVIHLFMNGGPSQMDLFDPKPELDRQHGKAYFDKIAGEVEFIKDAGAILRSPFKFARHGRCGSWVSEAMPH